MGQHKLFCRIILCLVFLQAALSASCGNRVQERGEECDDGNRRSGDGCSNNCRLEEGYQCPTAGRPCKAASLCGNKATEAGEECDDGNRRNGDGCDERCRVEGDFRCRTQFHPSVCSQCGNGILNGG